MAWQSQTLAELIARVEQDFSARFFGTSAPLRRSVLKVLARVWAAIVFLLTLLLEWIYRNSFVHLCDPDQVPLHGIPIGIYQTPSQFASGPVKATGTIGETVDQGTIIQDIDGNLEYETVQDYDFDENGEAVLEITSLDGGTEYNQLADTIMEFQSSNPNWDTEVVVQEDGLAGGDDQEDLEDERARILYKKQNPPQGGADADYVQRVTALPNITQAWVLGGYPQANNVQVVLADYDKVELTPPQPPTVADADVERAQESITDPTWKPVTAVPIASSCIPANVVVGARIRPNTSQNRDAANREIRALFIQTGTPNKSIPDETITAAITKVYSIEAAELDQLLQDDVPVEAVTLGFKGVAWLSGSTYGDLV